MKNTINREQLLSLIHLYYEPGSYKLEQTMEQGGPRVRISRGVMSDAFLIEMFTHFTTLGLHYNIISERDTPQIVVLAELNP